jgi:hypothetical protein
VDKVTSAYGLDPVEEAAMTATYGPEDEREDAVPSPDDATEEAPLPGSGGARATPDDTQPPPTTV